MERFSTLLFSLSLITNGVALAATPAQKAAIASQKNKKQVDEQLQSLVSDAFLRVEALQKVEPWQRTVFDQEVVPQFRRFVKEYRQSGDKVLADIDLDSIRKYLALSSSRLGRPDGKFGFVALANKECVPCTQALPEFKAMIKTRFERRGFKIYALQTQDAGLDLSDGSLTSTWSDRRDRILGLSSNSKDLMATLVAELAPATNDAIDTAHADDKKYVARLYLLTKSGVREFKSEGELEVLANESVLAAGERVLTDAITEVGGELTNLSDEKGAVLPEVYVSVHGLKSFEALAAVRAKLMSLYGEALERKLKKNEAVFGIRTRKSHEELVAEIAPEFSKTFIDLSVEVL